MAVAERRTAAWWGGARDGEEAGAEVDTVLCAAVKPNKTRHVELNAWWGFVGSVTLIASQWLFRFWVDFPQIHLWSKVKNLRKICWLIQSINIYVKDIQCTKNTSVKWHFKRKQSIWCLIFFFSYILSYIFFNHKIISTLMLLSLFRTPCFGQREHGILMVDCQEATLCPLINGVIHPQKKKKISGFSSCLTKSTGSDISKQNDFIMYCCCTETPDLVQL